jgi:hypothetical protein
MVGSGSDQIEVNPVSLEVAGLASSASVVAVAPQPSTAPLAGWTSVERHGENALKDASPSAAGPFELIERHETVSVCIEADDKMHCNLQCLCAGAPCLVIVTFVASVQAHLARFIDAEEQRLHVLEIRGRLTDILASNTLLQSSLQERPFLRQQVQVLLAC